MVDLNEAVFRAINRWPSGLDPFMGFFAEATNYLGVRIALLALVVYLIWRGGMHRRAGVGALVAVALANTLTDVFKKGYPTPRPCNQIPDAIQHGIGCSSSFGTASAHSANMAAVAFVFTVCLGRKWGWPWIAVALITGVSRVFHAAHYPAQVIAGWTCGCVCAALVLSVAKRLEKKPAAVSTDSSDEAVVTP